MSLFERASGIDFGLAFGLGLLLFRVWFGQAVGEGLCPRPTIHVAALMRPSMIVSGEIVVENRLHLVRGVQPNAVAQI